MSNYQHVATYPNDRSVNIYLTINLSNAKYVIYNNANDCIIRYIVDVSIKL